METEKVDAAITASQQADMLGAFCPLDEAPQATARPWPDGLPQPGIYPNVDYATYRAWPAVNASALKILATVTPKHAKAYIDGRVDKDSPDRLIGRGFHCALLEPSQFVERFPCGGICAEEIKSGPRKGQPCGNQATYRDDAGNWYCGTHAKAHPGAAEPPEVLTLDQAGRIDAMKREVCAHKVVHLLRQHGGCEVSLVWVREGVPCKARTDKLIIDRNCPDTIIDLKKIQPMAGTLSALQSAITNYGYDLAAAWYVDGVKALRPDKDAPLFAWVFAEDAPPFDVHPVWASKRLLEVGRAKANRAFGLWKWCAESNTWPGYCDDIEEIDAPDWELRRYGLAQ